MIVTTSHSIAYSQKFTLNLALY